MSLFEEMKNEILFLLSAGITGLSKKKWEEKFNSDEAKAHQYLSWAIEKKEGWSKIDGKWEPVTIIDYYAKHRDIQVKSPGCVSWTDNFQLEPPQPVNLTLEEVKEYANTDTEVQFWDDNHKEYSKGRLIGMCHENYVGLIDVGSGIGKEFMEFDNCTKPGGEA